MVRCPPAESVRSFTGASGAGELVVVGRGLSCPASLSASRGVGRRDVKRLSVQG